MNPILVWWKGFRKNVSHGDHTQFRGHRFIGVLIIGIVSITPFGVSLADNSSQATVERPKPTITSEIVVRHIPLSNLNLTLTGVIKAGKDIALICVEGARDKAFTVNETIVPGVRLLAVDLFSAVISRNGTLERLEFNRRPNTSSTTIVNSLVPVPAPAPEPPLFSRGRMVAFIPADVIQDLGNSRFNVKRSFVNDQLRSGDLFDHVRMLPDTSGGFRVSEVVQGSLYDTMGLKDGDKISAINGKPLKSAIDLMSFYEQRDSINTMQIQIMRDSALTNFQLDFQ